MKLVIPMAGIGVGLRPHTFSKPKPLLHVAGEPLISHVLKTVEKLPIEEAIFIVGEFSEKVITYVRKRCWFKTRFVKQKHRKGVAHAVYGSKSFFKKDEDLIILFADTIFEPKLKTSMLKTVGDGIVWVSEVEDPSKFGICYLQQGLITRMIEKPKIPLSNKAAIGVYYLKSSEALFNAIKELFKSDVKTFGMYQLTDALQLLIQKGLKLEAVSVKNWLDCGSVEGLLKANQYLLKSSKKKLGKVKNSLIIEPVFIEKNALVEDSIIGPDVSIGSGSRVVGSIVKNSIIGGEAIVINANVTNSVIGDNAIVKQESLRLNIGDNSEVFHSYNH
ncbi:NTP transferase domain-containing protein [Candidatus Woesearchaeota archaeon]|nr:NTP transferase domain-containing protein [Candidatus Woesearchaeota archaeon]